MHIRDNIASEFDAFSFNYTKDMIGCVPHYTALLAAFTEALPKRYTPETILDLGCGNGNVAAELLKQFPNAHYTLLDASAEMLRLCHTRFQNPDIKYICSYFRDHIFEEATYDMVAAGFSMHHCDRGEKQQLFGSIFRSLKPGGIFGFSDLMIDRESPEHEQLLKDWKAFVMKSYPDGEKWTWLMEHYKAFDKPDAMATQLRLLEEAGFSKVEPIFREGPWVHLRAFRLSI